MSILSTLSLDCFTLPAGSAAGFFSVRFIIKISTFFSLLLPSIGKVRPWGGGFNLQKLLYPPLVLTNTYSQAAVIRDSEASQAWYTRRYPHCSILIEQCRGNKHFFPFPVHSVRRRIGAWVPASHVWNHSIQNSIVRTQRKTRHLKLWRLRMRGSRSERMGKTSVKRVLK